MRGFTTIFGQYIDEGEFVDLIKNGSTAKIRGFKSKTGKSFDAKLVFKDNKIQFDFS